MPRSQWLLLLIIIALDLASCTPSEPLPTGEPSPTENPTIETMMQESPPRYINAERQFSIDLPEGWKDVALFAITFDSFSSHSLHLTGTDPSSPAAVLVRAE